MTIQPFLPSEDASIRSGHDPWRRTLKQDELPDRIHNLRNKLDGARARAIVSRQLTV